MSSVELSKQKLDIDDAVRYLQGMITKYTSDQKILIRGMKALDSGENILESNSMLAAEVKRIMRELLLNK